MKFKLKTLIVLFLALVSATCSDDQPQIVNDVYHTWEAKQFISLESIVYQKDEENKVTLTIQTDHFYGLGLDINGCSGNVENLTNTEIQFSSPLCTLICCDSDFAEKLAQLLPQVETYTLDRNELRLFVPEWGFIVFELFEPE